MPGSGPSLDTRARLSRRSLLSLALLAAVGAIAAACARRAEPGWTYAPSVPPSITPPPESVAPSAPASPSPAAGSPSAGGGPVIRIVALNVKFDLAEFSVPANTPFQIVFENQDAGIPHNVAIYDSGPAGSALFQGEIFNGVRTVTYDVPGLPPDNHYFQCDVHPNMNGTVRSA